MIIDWGKVNSNLKWLIKAEDNPYFHLQAFCIDKGLNYDHIIGFITIGRQIRGGTLDITKELKNALNGCEETTEALSNIDLNSI